MNSDALAARIERLLGSSESNRGETFAPGLPTIPNHEILGRIGRGSYGEVWLARSDTGALRSVKVVWRSHFESDRPYEREFRGIVQFEPISRAHPAVVNVLHVGRNDSLGFFFYVMELADAGNANEKWRDRERSGVSEYTARTLAFELKARGRLPVSEVIALGVQLSGALGHLHRHGLVHRDVKPSNVIFVQGQPKLADIGLVTKINEDHSFVGTEGFIPPEGPGTEKADLFGLGRLLYEAATGKNRSDFPGLPDDLDRWDVPERERLLELNAVLMRACAVEAKERHSNAAELAGDLNLILAGRSVRRAYRIENRLRQTTLLLTVALLLVLGATLSNWLLRRQRDISEQGAQRERALRERAESAERQGQRQLYTALFEQARATVLSSELGHRVSALDAVRRAAAISNSVALRGAALAALALPDLPFERDVPIPPDLTLAELDPKFERIALGRGRRPVEIRSVANGQLLAELPGGTNREAYVALWSSDGRFLAVKGDQDVVAERVVLEVWDVSGGSQVMRIPDVSRNAFCFHPNRPLLLVESASRIATVWDLETGKPLARFPTGGEAGFVKFSPDGAEFAALRSAGDRWAITIHRSDTGEVRLNRIFPEVTPDFASDFCWHPSGDWIAVSDRTGAIHWMNAQSGEARVLGRHKAAAVVTVMSPEGRYLFTGGWDRELICWDLARQSKAFALAQDSYRIQLRSDGRECAILRWPVTSLQLRSFAQPGIYREFSEDLGGGRTTGAFSADGRWLAAGGEERIVLWDLTGDAPGSITNEKGVRHLAFGPHDELFASRINEGFRRAIKAGSNSHSPPALQRLDLANSEGLISLCLLSNGVVFTGSNGSRFTRFDQITKGANPWKPTVDGLNGASPDGRWLGMFRSHTPELYIHRLPELQPVKILTNQSPVSVFAFSPSNDELAVASNAGVEFWSTSNWQRTRNLTNFTAILYAPNARTFWLSTHFRSAGLYDAKTAELLLPLPAGTLPLAVSPDGRYLAVTVDARRVQVWDLEEVRARLVDLGLGWAEGN